MKSFCKFQKKNNAPSLKLSCFRLLMSLLISVKLLFRASLINYFWSELHLRWKTPVSTFIGTSKIAKNYCNVRNVKLKILPYLKPGQISRMERFAKRVKSVNYGSSRPEVFCKKGVLRNFTKFTGKNPRQSLFFNKVDPS